MKAIWSKFKLGFWHPFGAYTGLSADQILDRKAREIDRHGFTFWSFVHSKSADTWLAELADARGPVYALCSHSPGARDPDPHQGALLASHYRRLGGVVWSPMPNPNVMNVTNPFKRRGMALGFKVRRVITVEPMVPPIGIEWFSRADGTWNQGSLPTRGEFLLRRGGSHRIRPIRAVLELEAPYLVELKRHEVSSDA